MTKGAMEGHIRKRCRDAGCDGEAQQRHREQYLKHGWDPHPPATFIGWWEPDDTDEESGASIGGQPDATRVWARKDQGGWNRRTYGFKADSAWNTALHRELWQAWVDAGSPKPEQPFVSICVPLPEMRARLTRIEAMLDLGPPLPDEKPPLALEDRRPL